MTVTAFEHSVMAMRMNTGQGNEEHHEEPTQYPQQRELTAETPLWDQSTSIWWEVSRLVEDGKVPCAADREAQVRDLLAAATSGLATLAPPPRWPWAFAHE
jgi:hypothetical protein